MKVYKKLMNALAAVEKIVLVISQLLILVLNVGNTAISAGAFAGEELRFVAQTATRQGATAFDPVSYTHLHRGGLLLHGAGAHCTAAGDPPDHHPKGAAD